MAGSWLVRLRAGTGVVGPRGRDGGSRRLRTARERAAPPRGQPPIFSSCEEEKTGRWAVQKRRTGGRARRCGGDLEACAGCAGALRNREGASPHFSVRCCFRGGYRMASAPLSALLLQHGRAKRAVNRPLCAPCCCHSSPSLSPPLAAVGLVPPLRLALPGGKWSGSGKRRFGYR